MRKIVATTFISIDGVMQAPGGPTEDPSGGFQFGGWQAPHFDEALGVALGEVFSKPFDLLLGRKTYDIFAAYWPFVGKDDPLGPIFDRITKYVATRTPDRTLGWQNSQTLGTDIVATLNKVKQSDGPDMLVQGSSDLIQTLLANDLIDDFTLVVIPVVLGKGKRLFGDGAQPVGMQLVSSQTTPAGVIVVKYRPDGEVKIGDFSLESPTEAA